MRGWLEGAELLSVDSLLKNSHYVLQCIMVQWGVSLYKYTCAVTMLQEGQGMMAESECALQQIFRLCSNTKVI